MRANTWAVMSADSSTHHQKYNIIMHTPSDTLELLVDGPKLTITLNRPEQSNALSGEPVGARMNAAYVTV